MEDYSGASSERYLDLQALLAFQPPRTTAAIHLGGIAIECQIKGQILSYHGIDTWSQNGRRTKEPQYGRPVTRPGHHLLLAVKAMTRVYEKAKADRLFIEHLDKLLHPAGSRDIDFIDLRYEAENFDDISFAEWQKSFNYVRGWLQKNEVFFV